MKPTIIQIITIESEITTAITTSTTLTPATVAPAAIEFPDRKFEFKLILFYEIY